MFITVWQNYFYLSSTQNFSIMKNNKLFSDKNIIGLDKKTKQDLQININTPAMSLSYICTNMLVAYYILQMVNKNLAKFLTITQYQTLHIPQTMVLKNNLCNL